MVNLHQHICFTSSNIFFSDLNLSCSSKLTYEIGRTSGVISSQGKKLKLGEIRQVVLVSQCTSMSEVGLGGKDSLICNPVLVQRYHSLSRGRYCLYFFSWKPKSKILSHCVPSTAQHIMADLRFKPSSSNLEVCAPQQFTATSVGKSYQGSGNEKCAFSFTPHL